jgi:hypothetical protein
MAYGLRNVAGTIDSMSLQADGTCTLDVIVTQMSKPAAGGEPRVVPKNLQITGATLTQISTDPASGNDDLVTSISIANIDTSITSLVTLTHKIGAGTGRTIFKNVAIKPGDHLEYGENGVWMHYDQTLGVYTALAIALSRTTITSGSGTYTPPVGCRAINVRMVGGGGAGGSSAGASSSGGGGSGGGAGSSVEKLISPPASSYSYAVGAGGTAGAAGNNAGGNGVDTTFGSLTAKGGTGGTGSGAAAATVLLVAGGAGGVAGSGGDINPPGEPGSPSIRLTAAIVVSGAGGNSTMAGGANGRITQGDGAAASTNTGAGGAGGASVNSATNQAGGAGGSGVILIDEWF